MSTSQIKVEAAWWGTPSSQPGVTNPVDVTQFMQHYFDTQPGSPQAFPFTPIQAFFTNVHDPDDHNPKAFTMVYSIPQPGGAPNIGPFFRGAKEGTALLIVVAPIKVVQIVKAYYGGGQVGLDITSGLQRYVNDPANKGQIVIGSTPFLDACTGSADPVSGWKCLNVVYKDPPNATVEITRCGYDTQTITL
jgi:hypothetical protein